MLNLRSRVHEQVNSSDQASRAVTPHGEPLADASTPSRSQTMLPLTISTICMSLVAGALAGKAEVFVREVGSPSNAPDVTVSAPSRITCSLRCTALGKGQCQGFRFLTNGTCLLYKNASLDTTGTPSPEGDTGSDRPAIYRRPAPPSDSPGL